MAYIKKPYAQLGQKLKTFREQTKRSVEEVSGAVEIEERLLKQIEEGNKRPTEDLMLLLISYFKINDKEAVKLWGLARYDSDLTDHIELYNQEAQNNDDINNMMNKPMVMLFSMDVRTMYSDGVEVSWNEAGMTINFTQTNPQTNDKSQKSIPVARVGMSYEQAENVIRTLQTAMLHAKYTHRNKLLPPTFDNKS